MLAILEADERRVRDALWQCGDLAPILILTLRRHGVLVREELATTRDRLGHGHHLGLVGLKVRKVRVDVATAKDLGN